LNKVPYAIPKQNEGYVKSPETYAEERVKELCNNIERVRKNAKLVDGCSGIQFENKFVILLDEGYLSFLIGLYHSTVSICSIAMERLCYDLVENSLIQIDGQELDYEQKKSLFDIPIFRLIGFLRKTGHITGQMQEYMQKLNSLRNKYVHPLLEGVPFEDANESINLLCKIIDSFIQKVNERSSSTG
jgi:hypothetical protein